MAFEQTSRRYGRFYRDARKYASRKEVLVSMYLILSLFTVSFFAAVFIRPTAITIAKLWREIQDKREIYTKLEKKINDLEEAQSLYLSIKDDLIVLDKAMPETPEFAQLSQKIEYLASQNEMGITAGRYGAIDVLRSQTATPSASDLEIHPFSFTMKGSFVNVKSFLDELENFDRIVNLKTVKIAASKEKRGAINTDLTLFLDSETFSFTQGLDLQK